MSTIATQPDFAAAERSRALPPFITKWCEPAVALRAGQGRPGKTCVVSARRKPPLPLDVETMKCVKICPHCDGTGWRKCVTCPSHEAPVVPVSDRDGCRACRGTGLAECEECEGLGYLKCARHAVTLDSGAEVASRMDLLPRALVDL